METYELLDSGEFQKLEKIGKFTIIRPSAHANYRKSSPSLWKNIDAIYERNSKGGGAWIWKQKPIEDFLIELYQFKVLIKFTSFGHLGIFPEQLENWKKIEEIAGRLSDEDEIINLFAYSGLSTLAVLKAKRKVTHLDSAKGMVDWAKRNALQSGLEKERVRWIVDDVVKFLTREIKRGKVYKGIIFDPPSFGRGSKGEVWKIEENLDELLNLIWKVSGGDPDFILFSTHSIGYAPVVLERILRGIIKTKGIFLSRDMLIPEKSGNMYFSGSSSMFLSNRIL